MKSVKNVILFLLAAVFLVCGVVFLPETTGVLLILAGILMLPFQPLQKKTRKKVTTKQRYRIILAAVLALASLFTSPAAQQIISPTTVPDGSSFSIQFIDVGQADAALVQCDGHYMLIDGGNRDDSNLIYSVLERNKIDNLDIVVGTHAHEDHIGGLPGAFQYASANLTLSPVTDYDSATFENFAKYAGEKGGGLVVPKVGDTYSLGSARVVVLGLNSTDDTNDTSIVLKIQYGQTSFLFTGDAERTAEQVILDSGADLSATVLKVGHHGSDTSSCYQFLREVDAQYAVISCGVDNSYGHPHDEVLSRLKDAGVTLFRTDLQGDIFCTSDGESISFSVSKNADADTFDPN